MYVPLPMSIILKLILDDGGPSSLGGSWANRIWGHFIMYVPLPMSIILKLILDDGGHSGLGAPGLQPVLALM